MAEYIERKMLKSEMTEAMCGTGYQQWAIDVIDRLPTADVVEVVRCCDCEHKQENPDTNNTCYLTCNLKYGLKGTIDPTDYCSYGERKEGAENDKI